MSLWIKRCLIAAAVLIVGLTLFINVLLPPILLPRINAFLQTFSSTYALHIDRMKVNVFRMAYRFEDVKGEMKATKKPFLSVRAIDVSIAWRELLRLRVLTKISVENGHAILTKALFQDSKKPGAKPKEDAYSVRDKLFPVKIAQVKLFNAKIMYSELVDQPQIPLWSVRSINGYVTNINPSKKDPFSKYKITGEMLAAGTFMAKGKLNREKDPIEWSTKIEVRKIHLPDTNPALLAWVPLNFAEGDLEIFSEARSKAGKVDGYVKPYFDHAKVFQPRQDFKSVKHFFIDLIAAAGNVILRRSDDKSVALIIPFHSNADGKNIDVEEGKALSSAIEHGFEKPLKKGLENKYGL